MLCSEASAQGIFHKSRNRGEDPNAQISMEQFAKQLDDLEEELFEKGTIGVKSPDVWGQKRMTKYRSEYEKEMKAQVTKFDVTMNAALRRSDTAALTSATAIGAAIQPKPAPTSSGGAGATTSAPAAVVPNDATTTPSAAGLASSPGVVINNGNTNSATAGGSSGSSSGGGGGGGSGSVAIPTPGDLTKDLLTSIQGRIDSLNQNLLKLPDSLIPSGPIALEPTIALDERSRYLNHLHELRRINMGDDLSDLPGYGLYLVRMPISLLPGPKVRKGKGALVTVEAKHALSPDLLADTFRDVVIMDSAYQLNPIMLKVIHKVIKVGDEIKTKDGSSTAPQKRQTMTFAPSAAVAAGNTAAVSASLPLSESLDIYGTDALGVLYDAIKDDDADWYQHDPSILSWLMNELGAAHRFMREQLRNGSLADMFQPEQFRQLDVMIQDRNYKGLEGWRKNFLDELVTRRSKYDPRINSEPKQEFVKHNIHSTDILVYALMVQSVLVDRQLKQDMDVTYQRKGGMCPDLNTITFYDILPTDEAKAAFGTYVQTKWPIHVFALDPAVDQQNQIDLFSARSELQLALAVAVSTGNMNFDNATKYARQLQTDLETIALNRTAIGFGAGETTFGWRFYPRIQSPPTPSNPARIAGLLLNGGYGPNYIAKHRQIEPGPRECVAVVVVPNFVPAMNMTTIANWFEYAGHGADQKFDTSEMLAFSRKVQMAKLALVRVCDSGLYRPGELSRLKDRLAQLEAQLPTQEYRVPLPNEGDLAGSEIFSSAGARLAPRLLSWYGEPAKVKQDSVVMIMGTGFSIHETRVVAGGVSAKYKLLSRQVMELTIPSSARPIRTNDKRLIFDIHVATPNGISNHLFVETAPEDDVKAPAAVSSIYTVDDNSTTINLKYSFTPTQTGFRPAFVDGQSFDPLTIKWTAPSGDAPQKIEVRFTFKYKAVLISIPEPAVVILGDGNAYTIDSDDIEKIAKSFVERVAKEDLTFSASNPLPTITAKVSVKPVDATRANQAIETTNTLDFVPYPISLPDSLPPALAPQGATRVPSSARASGGTNLAKTSLPPLPSNFVTSKPRTRVTTAQPTLPTSVKDSSILRTMKTTKP